MASDDFKDLRQDEPGDEQLSGSGAADQHIDDPEPKLGRLSRLLIGVVGPDVRDLRGLPAEVSRYRVYGVAVLITTTMALFTMPIALTIALGGFRLILIPIAIIWASFIYNIDRWIVGVTDYKSLRDEVTARDYTAWGARKVGLFIVRLLLAGVIAATISEPLLLVIFRYEVQTQIDAIHNQRVQDAKLAVQNDSTGKYASEVRDFQQQITDAQTAEGTAQTRYNLASRNSKDAIAALNCEIYPDTATGCRGRRGAGAGTSGVGGCSGDPCQTRQEAVTRTTTELTAATKNLERARGLVVAANDNLLIKTGVLPKPAGSREMTIAEEKEADTKTAIDNLPSTKGFSAREEGLSSAADTSSSTKVTIWFVRALLLMFELIPVLLKLASPSMVYEVRARLRALRAANTSRAAFAAHSAADSERAQSRIEFEQRRFARRQSAADEVDSMHVELDTELKTNKLRLAHDLRKRRQRATYMREVRNIGPDGEADSSRTTGDSDSSGSTGPSWPEQDGLGQDGLGQDGLGQDEPNQGSPDQTGRKMGIASVSAQKLTAVTDRDAAVPQELDVPDDQATDIDVAAPGPHLSDAQLIARRWAITGALPNAEGGMALAHTGRRPVKVIDTTDEHSGEHVLKFIALTDAAEGARAAEQEIHIPWGDVSKYIAPVRDSGKADGYFYNVTPYYASGSLALRLRDPKPLYLGKVLDWTRQVLTGLRDAWTYPDADGNDYELMHLDIKPSNLVIDDNGNIRIIDWGLSSFASEQHHITASAGARFTPWYAPPEQVLVGYQGWPKGWRSPWSDIRSVGAVLYELITGHRPLWVEAQWMGLLGDQPRPLFDDPHRQLRFFDLLASQHPVPLLEFAPHLEPDERARLVAMEQVISTWLSPQRSQRTDGKAAEPDEALQMLAGAVRKLTRRDLGMPCGRSMMQTPPPRHIDPPRILDYDPAGESEAGA